MDPHSKNIVCLLLASAVTTLMLASCNVTSDYPVDVPPGSEVDVTPYLGEWTLWEVAGETPQQAVVVSVERAGTNVIVTVSDGMTSHTETALLTRVKGEVIASLRGETGLWNITKITLDADSNQMVVADLKRERLKQDIEAGLIAGDIYDLDTNYFSINITADSSSLRIYLSQQADLFYTNGIVLVR